MRGGVTLAKGLLLILGIAMLFPQPLVASACTSIASCTAEQQKLKQQQQEAKNNYEKNRREAQNIQGLLTDIQEDIAYTQSRIANTEEQLRVTNEMLNQLNGSIGTTEKRLASAYVSLYELSRSGTKTTQLIFQASFNDTLSQAQYVQAIQSQLKKEIEALQASKTDREAQKRDIESLKAQLEEERGALTYKKSRQTYLLSVAQNNASYFQGLSAEIQRKIATVERQISSLVAQASWGSDIVSVQQGSWYYNQLNYPNVKLGNSPYTVAQYGCLITSIAMVSTYYGETVTPPQIAQYPGNFNSEGYLLRQPPSPVSFASMSTSSINWATVNSELDAGRPVIVSIYIPSVGVINFDGSSHFIVLHGRAGSKYFMHDPLGPGRSYAAKYVKSMKLIRP